MKFFIKNTFINLMTLLVMVLSLGVHVSKMKCDKGGSVYIGTEVPSCSEENEVVCAKEQEKVTCCFAQITSFSSLQEGTSVPTKTLPPLSHFIFET